MSSIRTIVLALTAGLLLALAAQGAAAAEPATVTVRVEGFGGQTLLPQTTVATSGAPVTFPGGTCPGTSAGGALYDAVQGNWLVRQEEQGPEVDGILGQNLPALEEAGSYAYWAFFLNDEFATQGLCAQQVEAGADIVLVGACYATGPLCPTDPGAPEHFLTATPPPSRMLLVGEPATETIRSLNLATFEADASPPAGTTLDAGPYSATPQADGTASITFGAPGVYTLQAHAPGSVPSDPFTVCVHAPGDGGCGTGSGSASPGGGGVAGFTTGAAPYKGPYALVAQVTSVTEGRHYRRGAAPRLLSGRISSHSSVTSVSLSLRRSDHGRCSAYDATRARFVRARCGTAPSFQVDREAAFSYLLPEKLAPGRYVLDVQAADVAGNTLILARGTSRVVFYVS